MLVYETYKTPAMLEQGTRISSDSGFYISYKDNLYIDIVLTRQEEINKVIETEIAYASPSITAETFKSIIMPDYEIITRAEATTAREVIEKMLDELDESEVYDAFCLFSTWEPGVHYNAGHRIAFAGDIYEVVNNHVANYSPAEDKASYTLILKPTELIPSWSENDTPYELGAKIKVGEHVYESLVENNLWQPVDFPAGWRLIK